MVHSILQPHPSEASLGGITGDLRAYAWRVDEGKHHITERVFTGKKVKPLKYKSDSLISDLCALDISEIVNSGTTQQIRAGRGFVEKP
jgi:hypothetical protein